MPNKYDFQFEKLKKGHQEVVEELEKIENADTNALEYFKIDRVLAKMWVNDNSFYNMTYPELLKRAEEQCNLATDEELEQYNAWRLQTNEQT